MSSTIKFTIFVRKNELTVAGEATSKSIGSNIRLVVDANWIISPLFRQSCRVIKERDRGHFMDMMRVNHEPYELPFYCHQELCSCSQSKQHQQGHQKSTIYDLESAIMKGKCSCLISSLLSMGN